MNESSITFTPSKRKRTCIFGSTPHKLIQQPKNTSFIFDALHSKTNNSFVPSNLNSNRNTAKKRSTSKTRRSIFNQNSILDIDKESAIKSSLKNRTTIAYIQDQVIPLRDSMMIYDFCGCQNEVVPCQIIQNTFLTKCSLSQIKYSYEQVYSSHDKMSSSVYGKSGKYSKLFKYLPKNYPEIFYPTLHNLLNVLGQHLNQSQFYCLSWLQYHAKVQYLTYFLYKDIKTAFRNKIKFIQTLQQTLQSQQNESFVEQLKQKGYKQAFEKFISSYYDSIGANLVPITYYSKFVALLFQKKKGNSILISLFKRFIHKRQRQLFTCLKYLNFGEFKFYRNYLRELNWEQILENINN